MKIALRNKLPHKRADVDQASPFASAEECHIQAYPCDMIDLWKRKHALPVAILDLEDIEPPSLR